MKGEDKWQSKVKELAEQKEKEAAKKKQKVNSGPIVANYVDNEVTEITPIDPDALKRPIGKKKAKETLRRGGGDACMEALDQMWAKKEAFDMEKERKKEERYNASLALEKERLLLEQKKADTDQKRVDAELANIELERMKEEDKIMSKDISSLSEVQQQYYKLMQEAIVARRLSK